jgi:hypothetical protein
MIFDRISLVIAYTSLKVVELNEAPVKDILFNKTAYYGTKTIERFKTLNDLKDFINKNYPYQHFDLNCQCATSGNEAIWTPLSFNVVLPKKRYATFVNNMRGEFESAQEIKLNSLSVKACADIFKLNARLITLKKKYSCFEYVINQNFYVSPCEYVDLIINDEYKELITKLYPKSKHPDLGAMKILKTPEPFQTTSTTTVP